MVRYAASLGIPLAIALAALAQGRPGETTLEVVKYDALKETILKHRGKVVYVDFWFLGCKPCKDGFPHLIDLHARHAKDGLEVITVNVTAVEEDQVKQSLDYLRSIKAPFRNFALEEGISISGDRLAIPSFPSIYLFDRQGRWVHFKSPLNKEEVDRTVERFLKETVKK